MHSPMPVTRAGRGARKNGTSAPSSSANAGRSSRAAASGSTSDNPRSTAAASLDPPPRPAPDGMCLSRAMATRAEAPARARKRAAARAAGIKLYITKSFNERFAIIVAGVYVLGQLTIVGAEVYVLSQGLAQGFSFAHPLVWAALFMAVLLFLNYRGIRIAGLTQDIIAYTMFACLIVVSFYGFYRLDFQIPDPFRMNQCPACGKVRRPADIEKRGPIQIDRPGIGKDAFDEARLTIFP